MAACPIQPAPAIINRHQSGQAVNFASMPSRDSTSEQPIRRIKSTFPLMTVSGAKLMTDIGNEAALGMKQVFEPG